MAEAPAATSAAGASFVHERAWEQFFSIPLLSTVPLLYQRMTHRHLMIDVKEAAQIAISYFHELYPEESFSDILLEEFERTESDGAWLITVGFTDESGKTSGTPFGALVRPRRYRRFEIDPETGEVRSMKIRPVENV